MHREEDMGGFIIPGTPDLQRLHTVMKEIEKASLEMQVSLLNLHLLFFFVKL